MMLNATFLNTLLSALAGIVCGLSVVFANRLGFWLWKRFYATHSFIGKVGSVFGVLAAWSTLVGTILFFADATIIRPDVSLPEIVFYALSCVIPISISHYKGWLRSMKNVRNS